VKSFAVAFAQNEKHFISAAAECLETQAQVLSRREVEILSGKNKSQKEELLISKYPGHACPARYDNTIA
jgi:hypothetical protein